MQKREELSDEITEDEAEEEEADEIGSEENAAMQEINAKQEKDQCEHGDEQEDVQIGKCAVCHVIIDDTNLGRNVADSEQNSRCAEGYLLCQRCVRKISARSGADLQSRRSRACFSHGDDERSGRVQMYSGRTYSSPVAMCLQPPPPSQWTGNFNRTNSIDATGEVIDYDAVVSYVVDQNDPRREIEETESREKQYGGYSARGNGDRYACEIKLKSSSSADCSRRPIRCPRLDCLVNVAFSALTHHFLFDHPEVPILCVEPGAERTLIVSYGALSCNSSRCLALLLVSGKLSDSAARFFGGSQIHPKYRNRLPLPVLAARLHNNHSYACCEEMHAGGEGRCEKDMIIAWVAGLDISDIDRLRCSIQAVDSIENGAFRSLTYTGPVTSLRTAQCPRDVFLAGDCIVLHEGLIGHITSGCTSLNVNVVVH
ncbi:uncharacterized protein LOC105287098 [Ooceraea biroi]|uniref:uncharacterized protein LOC105287098 n=1 Tax=Ooceraea biroi TaxID=2015173 RepID=UPI0005BDF222|nr:uncharacterized protein LOC105287098 [Ooceraea biroi]